MHFCIFVFVPPQVENVGDYVDKLMEPYGQETKVKEYTRVCWCAEDNDNAKGEPDCDECKGSGITKTDYNPNGKWDGYRIGGRYDGAAPQISYKENEEYDNRLSDNICTVSRLIRERDKTPFSILTPRSWIPIGDLEKNEKRVELSDTQYMKMVNAVYNSYSRWQAVSVDCHR